MAHAEVVTTLTTNSSPLQQGLAKGRADIGSFAASAKSALGGMTSMLGSLGIGVGIGAAVGVVKASLEAYQEHQRAAAKLASVVASTGQAAGFSAGELQKYAETLGQTTVHSQDAVLGAEALMATFTNIKGDVFQDAIRAVSDISAVMGTDMKGAAIQVGKALNDPIKGVSALAEVGVSFNEVQKKQIADFVKMGNVAAAQKVILTELSKEFGKAGENMVTSADRASKAWDGLKRGLGELLAPVLETQLKGLTAELNFGKQVLGGAHAIASGQIGRMIGEGFLPQDQGYAPTARTVWAPKRLGSEAGPAVTPAYMETYWQKNAVGGASAKEAEDAFKAIADSASGAISAFRATDYELTRNMSLGAGGFNQADYQEAFDSRRRSVVGDLRSPQQQYQDQLARIGKFNKAGMYGEGEAERATGNALGSYLESVGTEAEQFGNRLATLRADFAQAGEPAYRLDERMRKLKESFYGADITAPADSLARAVKKLQDGFAAGNLTFDQAARGIAKVREAFSGDIMSGAERLAEAVNKIRDAVSNKGLTPEQGQRAIDKAKAAFMDATTPAEKYADRVNEIRDAMKSIGGKAPALSQDEGDRALTAAKKAFDQESGLTAFRESLKDPLEKMEDELQKLNDMAKGVGVSAPLTPDEYERGVAKLVGQLRQSQRESGIGQFYNWESWYKRFAFAALNSDRQAANASVATATGMGQAVKLLQIMATAMQRGGGAGGGQIRLP